jgi:hypothetical protein
LLRAGGDRAAAERSFFQGIGIAQQQSAKLWELDAARSVLPGSGASSARREAACDLLAPIYG